MTMNSKELDALKAFKAGAEDCKNQTTSHAYLCNSETRKHYFKGFVAQASSPAERVER